MTVVKGSPIDKLLKLFQSKQERELEASNRRRRVEYLKRKYGSKGADIVSKHNRGEFDG